MRISTSMQFNRHLNYLQTANSKLDKASERYNTGKLFQTAGEDPSGMASSIKYTGDISAYKQYGLNASIVADTLSQEETALGQIWDSLSSVQTRLIQAINGTMDDGARAALAEDIKQVQDQIFDLMNTKNAEGEYIFSGANSTVPTYKLTSDGRYECQADGSNKYVIVSPTVKVQTTDSGLNIFENTQLAHDFTLGNTTPANGVTISGVDDYDQFNTFFKEHFQYKNTTGDNTFRLLVNGPDGDFSLVDRNGNELAKGEIKDGKINVEGMEFTLSDDMLADPVGTVEFTLDEPKQDNILNQLTDIINKLNVPQDEWGTPGSLVASSSALTQDLSSLQITVENAKKQVDSYRGLVGARGANIDAIIKSDETLSDIKSEAKANVTEIDAFTAVSDLLLNNNALQVAQQSYNIVHSSTLFNYI